MEQERSQNQPQQPQAPLQCPRCNSVNTKFRYFNNHSLSQPRHYCRDCKRLWTVGGSLRDIPVGGTTRNKQTKAPCSFCGSSSAQPQPPQLPSGVEMAPTLPQPLINFQEPIAPLNSFYFDNEFANLDAIDSLIQPEVMNQTVNVENQVGFGSADVNLLQDWNVQSLASEQALPQQIQGYNGQSDIVDPGMVELNQFHDQAAGSYQLPNYDLVQPTWPMEFTPQEAINDISFSTADACLWDNFSGVTTNMDLPSTSVDPTQWPDFPGYGPP